MSGACVVKGRQSATQKSDYVTFYMGLINTGIVGPDKRVSGDQLAGLVVYWENKKRLQLRINSEGSPGKVICPGADGPGYIKLL